MFQLKVFFENIISCLQRFELLCCTAASQYSTCNTRRIFSGLDPQLVSHHQAGIVSPGLLKIPTPGEQSESRCSVACRVLGQEQVNKGPHGLLGQASHVTLRVGGQVHNGPLQGITDPTTGVPADHLRPAKSLHATDGLQGPLVLAPTPESGCLDSWKHMKAISQPSPAWLPRQASGHLSLGVD